MGQRFESASAEKTDSVVIEPMFIAMPCAGVASTSRA
jgi:hypothetical protein